MTFNVNWTVYIFQDAFILDGGSAGIFVWVGKVRFLKKKMCIFVYSFETHCPSFFLELLNYILDFFSVLLVL